MRVERRRLFGGCSEVDRSAFGARSEHKVLSVEMREGWRLFGACWASMIMIGACWKGGAWWSVEQA